MTRTPSPFAARPLTPRPSRVLMGTAAGAAPLGGFVSVELVRHGFHQMLLRRTFWLQEPHAVHLDLVGARRHDYKGPSLTEVAAMAVQIQRQHGPFWR
jgi:hypothetical protein